MAIASGTREKTSDEQIQHRWQMGATRQPLEELRLRRLRRRRRVSVLILVAILLSCAQVWYLLFLPAQVPVITAFPTDYSWPMPPNSWSNEDLQGLRVAAGATIDVTDISSFWRTKHSGLQALKDKLSAAVRQHARSRNMIIYLSMHGAVDDQGVACLIPPSASPHRAETWLTMPELLRCIKEVDLPTRLNKVIILDSNRMQTNWHIGLLYNGFADALASAVESAAIPNLVILNSTSPNQRGWASADLRGSVFGHYLRLGLAGAADQRNEGGDGDRRVSLHELHRYLGRHVDQWVRFNRADRQRPMLVPANANDFALTWTLNRRSLRRLQRSTTSAAGDPATIAVADIQSLWKKRNELLAFDPYRFDPIAWRNYEQRLSWLEDANFSGSAYADSSRRLFRELTEFQERVQQSQIASSGRNDLILRWNTFSEPTVELPTRMDVFSLPLHEYLGQFSDRTDLDRLATRFADVRADPSLENVHAALEELEASRVGATLAETNYLRMLDSFGFERLWQRPDLLSDSLSLLDTAARMAVPGAVEVNPGDVRAHTWLQPELEQADQSRRESVDMLFVGTDEAFQVSARLQKQAVSWYERAGRRQAELAGALERHDRAWFELFYYAQWATRVLPPERLATELDRRVNEELLELIELSHSMSGLRIAEPDQESAVSSLIDAADRISEQLRVQESYVREEVSRLLQASQKDSETLRDILDVLRIPMIAADDRKKLRQKARQVASELNVAFGQSDSSIELDGNSDDARQPRRGHTNRLLSWRMHPALAILEPPLADATAESDTDASSLVAAPTVAGLNSEIARQGAQIRQHLASLEERCRRLATEERTSESSPQPNHNLRTHRIQFARAAQLTRAASPFWFSPFDQDPMEQLRQCDVQTLLLWHAQRSLDDFWGRAANASMAYFERAANTYIDSARAIMPDAPSFSKFAGAIRQKLSSRRLAANGALTTTAEDMLLVSKLDTVPAHLHIHPTSHAALAGLPIGKATTFVRDARGRLAGTFPVWNVPDMSNERNLDYTAFHVGFSGSDLHGRGPILEAVTYFRGHEFTVPFLLRSTTGPIVRFEPLEHGSPKITLSGPIRETASIVFILDCSNTMRELMETERPGGSGVQMISRLDAAVGALRQMLRQLAIPGNVRVGVRFFGHRVGWNQEQRTELLRQEDYARPIPPNLLPSEDVELVLPLGRFDSIAASHVLNVMETLVPWGESPIYAAIVEGLRDLEEDRVDAARRIVVITDGMNYQFNSPGPKTMDDVLAARGQSDTTIHIVGFDIPAGEFQQSAEEFTHLATATGGRFVPVSNGAELGKTLESLLASTKFRVTTVDGQDVTGAVDLGSTVTIDEPPEVARTFRVRFESVSEEVILEGGEALDMVVSRDGQSIESRLYLQRDPRFARLVDSANAARTGFQVGIHRPARIDGSVSFQVSIQSTTGRFTPRPDEIWIEVTPLADDTSTRLPSYVFYDANFVPDKPVPLVEFTAESWPEEARAAEFRVWCKYGVTEPAATAVVGMISERLHGNGTGNSIDNVHGYSYQVQTLSNGDFQVGVVERFSAGTADFPSMRVELDPQASRVLRQFDPKNRIVTHTFTFPRAAEQVVMDGQLNFYSRNDLRAGSWTTNQPVIVEVVPTNDLLRLTPPEQVQ